MWQFASHRNWFKYRFFIPPPPSILLNPLQSSLLCKLFPGNVISVHGMNFTCSRSQWSLQHWRRRLWGSQLLQLLPLPCLFWWNKIWIVFSSFTRWLQWSLVFLLCWTSSSELLLRAWTAPNPEDVFSSGNSLTSASNQTPRPTSAPMCSSTPRSASSGVSLLDQARICLQGNSWHLQPWG